MPQVQLFLRKQVSLNKQQKYLATSKMMLKNSVGIHLAGSVRVYNMMSPHWVHDMPHDVTLKVKWAKREETECKVCCASPYCWHSEHVVLAEGKLQQKTGVEFDYKEDSRQNKCLYT